MWPLHTGFFCLVERRILYAAGFSWLDSSFCVCAESDSTVWTHYGLSIHQPKDILLLLPLFSACRVQIDHMDCSTEGQGGLVWRTSWLGSQVLAVMNKVAIQVDIHFQHIWVAWFLSGSCGLGGRGTLPCFQRRTLAEGRSFLASHTALPGTAPQPYE